MPVAEQISRFYTERGRTAGHAKPPPLAAHGATFLRAAEGDEELALLMAAIGWCETHGGLTGPGATLKNAFGLMIPGGGGLRSFPDFATGIGYLADLLRGPLYIAGGLTTIPKIGGRYCPVDAANDPSGKNRNWVPCVTAGYRQLGGTRFLKETPMSKTLHPPLGGYAFVNLGGVAAHKTRPPYNWQSDNAADLGCPPGTKVYAIGDGVIARAPAGFGKFDWQPGSTVWGHRLTLDLDAGYPIDLAYYAHLGGYAKGIAPGVRVKEGQLLGRIGNPAWPNGPGFPAHLHIGVSPWGFSADWFLRNRLTVDPNKPGPPYVTKAFDIPILRKVGQVGCTCHISPGNEATSEPGRWQVIRDGELLFQGQYKPALAFYEEKRAYWERRNERRP